MRLCLIGPTYPFRGGISHFTTILATHLEKRHDVLLYSFKRQYPRFLFPGVTDRDPSSSFLRVDCEYLMDPLNPLTWIRTFQKIRDFQPEVLILQWWVPFWTPSLATLSLLIKRFTPIKILFICHHIAPPDGGPFDLFLAQYVLSRGDYFIVLAGRDSAKLRQILPQARPVQTVLPTFDAINHGHQDPSEARRRLGVDGKVILFFGFVRRYKGLRHLIEAMPFVLERIKATLLVVGEFWDKEDEYLSLIRELGLLQDIVIVNRYIHNEEVALYFSAADIVVLPYVETSQSGVAPLAFSFDKPVITTNVGGLVDVVRDGETGFIVPPGDSVALGKAIVKFFTESQEERFIRNIQAERDLFSWSRFVGVLEQTVQDHE